jgi:hypothetical protein
MLHSRFSHSTLWRALVLKPVRIALCMMPFFLLVSLFRDTPLNVHAQRALQVPPPSSITQISPVVKPGARALISRRSLSNVMVNDNTATLRLPQTEPSIASNPADFRQLVTGFADQSNGDFAPGVSISRDG